MDFKNEIDEIYKLAGVQLNEEQGYFTDWKNIKKSVIERFIDARLVETGMLCDDDYYIQEWLEQNASADMLDKLYEECGTNEIQWVASYINKNPDEGGVISQVAKNMASELYDRLSASLLKEFEQNNLIYRLIDSDKSPKEIAQILKTNGTGNCWAKQEENAFIYNGTGNDNEYCLIGEATMDNVNWETTIFLRMMAEDENEVRLKKDSPIHIVGIKYYHFNEDNKIDKKDHMKVDMMLNVGHSYVFNESKQTIIENVKKVIPNNYCTTYVTSSAYDVKNYIERYKNVRILYDKINNWYFLGDSETKIHAYLLDDAISAGYYNAKSGNELLFKEGNKFILLLTAQYLDNRDDFTYDDWKYQYVYDSFSVFDRKKDFKETTLYKILGEPKSVELIDDEELNESIAYASKKDLSDVVLLNPTRKELRDNKMFQARCMEDSDGNWYFCDMFNMLHSNVESIFRENVFFPLYDGNDNYGISYYDLENNEFWYNENSEMTKKKCIQQYKSSEYLMRTFVNAKVVPNPYGWNEDEDEEQLDEELLYMEKSNYDDYQAVILKNPTRKELRDNNLKRARFINFANDIWLFFDAMQWIHEEVIDKYAYQYGKAKNVGFYDYDKNQFVFIHFIDENISFDDFEIKDKNWLLKHPYIINNFGNNINVKAIDEYHDNPWEVE